jgi:hypothetical protein
MAFFQFPIQLIQRGLLDPVMKKVHIKLTITTTVNIETNNKHPSNIQIEK